MRYKVFSGRVEDIEAGYEPHLEGLFKTLKDAEAYAQSWRSLYSDSPTFWVAE